MAKKINREDELIEKIKKVNKKMKEIDKKPITNEKNRCKNILQKDIKELLNFKNIKINLFEKVVVLVNVALIFCLVGYLVGVKINLDENYENVKADKEIQTFIEQYNYILNNYYGDINKEQLITNAINGMLGSLDEHSGVLDDSSNSFNITLDGKYEGLGVTVTNDVSGRIIVISVYEDTPASKAGIKPGDIIKMFNNNSLENMTSTDFVNLVKETKKIELTLERNNEEIKVNIEKDKIVLKSVYLKVLENKIGYVQISIFANNTYDQFKDALEQLEKAGIKNIIIDVRGNSGGHLTAVEKMLSLFVDKKHVIYQTESSTGIEKIYSSGKENKDFKIVILQNQESASASEILAASLKENLNSYIIGKNSFGKGTVQQLQKAGEIQYKFTTKKWLTPNGTWINGVGIKPDLEIELGKDYIENPVLENDTQYKAALDYFK